MSRGCTFLLVFFPFSFFFFVSIFFHFLRNLACPYSFSACYFFLFSFLTMFHRLLSLTRTFPELVIDCIGSTAARQSTIEMFSRTCCRYLCERLKEYIRQEFYGGILRLARIQGFNYSTQTCKRNVNFRILICTFSTKSLPRSAVVSGPHFFSIFSSTKIGRFYSINRPARQSTTVRFQRAPFQAQMSTVTGGKTQPEGRKRGKKNGTGKR